MSDHAQDRERERARARAYHERRAAWQAHRARHEEITAPVGEEVRARREAYLEHLARQEREGTTPAEGNPTPTEDTPAEGNPAEGTPPQSTTPHNRGRPRCYPPELIKLIRRLHTRERLNARQIAARLQKLGHPAPSLAQIHRYLTTATSRPTTKGHGSRE